MAQKFGDGLGIATLEAILSKYVPTNDGGFNVTFSLSENQNPAWFQEMQGRVIFLVAVPEDCHEPDAVNAVKEAIDFIQTKR